MIDTVKVEHLDQHKTIYRELCLFRVKINTASDSMQINQMAKAYGGIVHDVTKNSLVVEMTATPDQIKAF